MPIQTQSNTNQPQPRANPRPDRGMPSCNGPSAGRGPVRIVAIRPQIRPYDRKTDLPRLLALWPAELMDLSLSGRTELVDRLKRALRQERQRGRSGHWTYDLNRHAALLAAYRAEIGQLAAAAGQFRRTSTVNDTICHPETSDSICLP
jgi:hypothetical protein